MFNQEMGVLSLTGSWRMPETGIGDLVRTKYWVSAKMLRQSSSRRCTGEAPFWFIQTNAVMREHRKHLMPSAKQQRTCRYKISTFSCTAIAELST